MRKACRASWAETEFGAAELGDRRRNARLVSMATGIAESPGGTITRVFRDSAEREGAYRFLENEDVDPKEISRAALRACLERTRGLPYFLVPVDESSITLTDRDGVFGFGAVGAHKFPTHGLEVVSAIGVSPDGTPLGYCGQQYWARARKAARKSHKHRPLEEKETRHWMNTISFVEDERRNVEGAARPWYLMDRGGDFKELLAWASKSDAWLTVRANADRILSGSDNARLWPTVEGAQLSGRYEVDVVGSHGRKARRARLDVRVKKIDLALKLDKSAAQLWAVLAQETNTVPDGEDPIEWLLLTNYPVADFADARMVIGGYSHRWRIEEFHRTWKTTCRVEDAQLRSIGAVQRWAIALAVVAMRIQRLTHLARNQPDLPASEGLTADEITALVLHKSKHRRRGQSAFVPTIAVAVTWLAELGGYTGKSSGGPPGAQTIARGLRWLMPAAATVALLRSKM